MGSARLFAFFLSLFLLPISLLGCDDGKSVNSELKQQIRSGAISHDGKFVLLTACSENGDCSVFRVELANAISKRVGPEGLQLREARFIGKNHDIVAIALCVSCNSPFDGEQIVILRSSNNYEVVKALTNPSHPTFPR